jgi:hypothetical protein
MSYFREDSWEVSNSSTHAIGNGYVRLNMPLFAIEIAYHVIQTTYAETNQNFPPREEYDKFMPPIWTLKSYSS